MLYTWKKWSCTYGVQIRLLAEVVLLHVMVMVMSHGHMTTNGYHASISALKLEVEFLSYRSRI